MFDSWESTVAVVVAVLIAYGVVLWLGTVVWVYRDIRSRTQDGWTQAVSVMLVVIFNLPGLFLYLVLRPQETLNDTHERHLEAEALMRDMPGPEATCPTCKRTVGQDYLVCPNCSIALREACSNCSRPLELSWSTCPFCASNGPKGKAKRGAESAPPSLSTSKPEPPRAAAPPPGATPMKNASSTAAKRPESAVESLWRRIVG